MDEWVDVILCLLVHEKEALAISWEPYLGLAY